MNNNNLNANDDDVSLNTKMFLVILKAHLHKKLETNSMYEELCRDLLCNESYFLFILDKIVLQVLFCFF